MNYNVTPLRSLKKDSSPISGYNLSVRSLAELPITTRLDDLPVKLGPPLVDAKTTIDFALKRFHESWHAYRSITPTLYGIRETGRGIYLTLGHLRRRYGFNQTTLCALTEAVAHTYGTSGYLLASEAVGGEPLSFLFGLQGHHNGEKHYGGLDLVTFQPFEGHFQTEFELRKDAWADARLEALSNIGLSPR